MRWRTRWGWVAMVWGLVTIGLGFMAILEDLLVSVLIGVGLLVPGVILIVQGRSAAESNRAN